VLKILLKSRCLSMCEKIVEVAVLVDVDAVHLHQKPKKQV
jgi:hypothetical protein